MENNRYHSGKIDIGKLLSDNSRTGKKFNLTGEFNKQTYGKEKQVSRERPVRYLSPKEYASIISMVIAAIYLMLISFFPIVYNFTSSFEPIDFLKNLFYFSLGLGIISGVFNYLRKETYLQHIADETFEKVIYQRLEPVLKDVAEVQVGINGVQNQLEMMNINIESLSNKKTQAATGTSNQVTYYTKYIVLINITLAVILFMLQYPFGYIPYVVTILFIFWWITITAEYKLWKVEIAWTWVFFPIIILPIYTIIMNTYLEDYQLFGSLAIGLCIYIISYYSWCSYLVKGVLPFDLNEIMSNIQENKLATKESNEKKTRYPKLNFNLNTLSRYKIAMGLILLSIALFGITWFAYAIQHDLIPNINWETIGLQGFEWPSSYTYMVNLFGILLIIIGFKMLKPIRT